MNFLLHTFIAAFGLWSEVTQAQGQAPSYSSGSGHDPVLTTVKNTPETSIFYDLIVSTGGSSGLPEPELEERFNDLNQGLKYTVLAPVNDAFRNVTPDELSVLKSPPVFNLLKSLILNHIFPGDLKEANSSTVQAIGGFFFTFDSNGGMTTNEGFGTSEVEIGTQARFVQNARIEAGNGAVYKIDRFVDSFLTYFGEQRSSSSNDLPAIEQRSGTMADIIRTDGEFSELYKVLNTTDPGFLVQLTANSSNGGSDIGFSYFAPGNGAFDVLPEQAMEKAVQPSNVDQTNFLLEAGYGQLAGDSSTLRALNGLTIDVRDGRANNARIDRRVCAENGCVWQVGRWIDPIYGVF